MDEVLGQEFPKRYFQEAVKNNKIAHSYLIEGPDGIGKSIFALHMAKTLLCTAECTLEGSASSETDGTARPCGVCPSCRKVEKHGHPDMKLIDTNKKSIGVNEIRALIEETETKPYEGSNKIFIVKKADMITIEGQNALLKTLEEPPANVIILLLAANSEALLPTIQSRCQTIRLGRVDSGLIHSFLLSMGIDAETATIAADLSDGIPGRALLQLEPKFSELRKTAIAFASKIVDTDPLTGLDQVAFFNDNKDQLDFIFETLNTWNRDIYMLKSTKNKKNIINKDFYDLLIEQSQLLSYNRLDRIIDILRITEQMIKRNANFQLAIEILLFKYQEK